jgi:hypothetical protein
MSPLYTRYWKAMAVLLPIAILIILGLKWEGWPW